MSNALIVKWRAQLTKMRAIVKEHEGKALPDTAFSEYRTLEDEADALSGRIANETGQPWGPRIAQDLSRVERLEARETWFANEYPPPRSHGLEMSGSARGTEEKQRPFPSLGVQLRSVIAAGTPGHQADPRLYELRAATGLGEGSLEGGGFAVQQDFAYRLLQAGMEASQLAPRCNPFPIGPNSNGIKLPRFKETSRATGSRFGGIQLYWGDEAEQLTASKPKFERLELSLKKLTGLVYLTDELLEDTSGVSLEAYVRQAFSSEFGWVLDEQILSGTGVGRPLGILTGAGKVTVSKEGSQAADTIRAENIGKMFARMIPSGLSRAVWLINQAAWPQIFQLHYPVKNVAGSENVGGIGPLYNPPTGLAGAPFGTLLGRPIIPMEQCSALGDVGDIIFADFGRYVLADKGAIQTASSIHVRFIYGESVLRFTYRVDGQPEMDSAITPANGTDTLSPFIVLEAR